MTTKIKIGIVGSREYTDNRKIKDLIFDIKNKYSLSDDKIAYLGDDMVDLPVMQLVGLPIAAANATPEILKVAKYTTKVAGGDGAFRDAVEWIIKMQGRTDGVKEKMIKRVLNS